jgi:hypothetical protein
VVGDRGAGNPNRRAARQATRASGHSTRPGNISPPAGAIVLVAGWPHGGQEDLVSAVDVTWEKVSGAGGPELVRTPVPGGWLVANASGSALVFVADRDHDWGAWEDDDDYDDDDDVDYDE